MNDKTLMKLTGVLLLLPIVFAFYSKDSFRYPCQDPANWDSPQCQKPLCDVNRACPEHVFKGGRDPRLGPPPEDNRPQQTPAKVTTGGCNGK